MRKPARKGGVAGGRVVASVVTSVVIVLALLLGLAVIRSAGGEPGTPQAAERIDVWSTSVPVRAVGSFGPAAAEPGDQPDPLISSADGDRTVAAVMADLQEFWNAQILASGGHGLRPPVGGHISVDSGSPGGSIAGQALCVTEPAQIAGNAFYCPQGDGIVFDSSALVPVLLGSYGSGGLTAAFAHEFGHAVQAQVGPTHADRLADPERYPAILIESQADCDAGAFLAWASTGSANRVHLPPESLVRAVAPLLDFRDPATVAPTDRAAHGLGLDRLSSLLVGFRNGAGSCLSMTLEDLSLTLGRPGVTTSPPSTLERFPSTADAMAAASTSVATFAGELSGRGGPVDSTLPSSVTAAPDELAVAAPIGQFASASAQALAVGRAITGTPTGAACFTGAWTASVFGHAQVDQLGSWPTDADEALDLIRARPGASFDELAAFADGFHQGWAGCG